MKRIDQETVRRIIDTADIVEVVSDFVSLKRRGANYVGLCPFHNERTPSFSVNRARGFCHCFSCGKGGGPVNFLMELEQLSYVEALRYLARKYNIEIQEEELTDEQREAANQRESMLAANEFAMKHFEDNLLDTPEGRDIGLSYFRERGINEAAVKRFHLGYAIDRPDALLKAARAGGFSDETLVSVGLEIRTDSGKLYDRFKGRVIYPVLGLSGKVVAFGGRILRSDKNMAKYVNSPESMIYSKSRELYGLYQARQAIVKNDKCILVEGYMDVISLHQSGVENVIASSGTSLTEGQIRLIRRFTYNITVIYDSDPAGIKASLRGIDMLLAEGMNVKVLSLPDGDDPDSFAQSHTATEVEEYLKLHEVDFIRFKTDILLKESAGDPIARAKVANDIVRSIACIPDDIARQVYIQESSRQLHIDDKVIALQVDKVRAGKAVEEEKKPTYSPATEKSGPAQQSGEAIVAEQPAVVDIGARWKASMLHGPEREVLRLVLRYGMLELCESYPDDTSAPVMLRVIDYVADEFAVDEITFDNSLYRATWESMLTLRRTEWPHTYAKCVEEASNARARALEEGEERIRQTATDMSEIKRLEVELTAAADAEYRKKIEDFAMGFFLKHLVNSPDDQIRRLAVELGTEKHVLSKIHSKYTHVNSERENLPEIVPVEIYSLKCAIIREQNSELLDRIKAAAAAGEDYAPLMRRQEELNEMRKELSRYLGDRIVTPTRKF